MMITSSISDAHPMRHSALPPAHAPVHAMASIASLLEILSPAQNVNLMKLIALNLENALETAGMIGTIWHILHACSG